MPITASVKIAGIRNQNAAEPGKRTRERGLAGVMPLPGRAVLFNIDAPFGALRSFE
ncbi:hypothetical protein PTKU46_37550 [Paraburkholderia terrae]